MRPAWWGGANEAFGGAGENGGGGFGLDESASNNFADGSMTVGDASSGGADQFVSNDFGSDLGSDFGGGDFGGDFEGDFGGGEV